MSKTTTTAPALNLMGCIDAIDKAAQIVVSLEYITSEINDLSPLPTGKDERIRVFAQSATQMHLIEFLESTMQTISAALSAISKTA